MATGIAHLARRRETNPGNMPLQAQMELEHTIVSDHARAHFGNNNTNYYGPVSHTSAVPAPTALENPRLLPRAANPQYVGYAHVLERLASCFLQQGDADHDHGQVICILSGMGGVGKSETVLQFLDKNDKILQDIFWAIFWVGCESETSAQADFERVSNACGWSYASDNVLSGVKDRLASSKKRSLLILDNCDDTETDYTRYIPHGSQVSVMMTTRLYDAKKYASLNPQDERGRLFIQLSGLDAESATDLLLGCFDIEERSRQITDQASHVAAALDFHPLAITVASSLIGSAVYSLEGYVNVLQDQLAQKELLGTTSEQARYGKVSATFEVSAAALQKLAATDPSAEAALALLNILGFMHHQDVSEDIFVRAWDYEQTILSTYHNEAEDDDGDIMHLSSWYVNRCQSVFSSLPPHERLQLFRRARAHLCRLSLLSVNGTYNCMSLHLLVHTWARERVEFPRETYLAVAATLALSAKGSEYWQPYTSQLVQHYKTNFAIWQKGDKKTSDQVEICRIWYAYAWQILQAKRSTMLEICSELLHQTKGLCYEHVEQSAHAPTMYLLGNAYLIDSQIAKAVHALTSVVNLWEKLTANHPKRLESQHALANAYLDNGETTRATNILEHVVRAYRETLAEDHPELLGSQHELARAYVVVGQTTQAIDILKHIVRLKEKKLGKDHPERLASQHGLAYAYLEDGQTTNAIEMLEHVVKVRNEKLAEDHPDRLASQHELARAYWSDGQIIKARELFELVVAMDRNKFPAGHPERVKSEAFLANVMRAEVIAESQRHHASASYDLNLANTNSIRRTAENVLIAPQAKVDDRRLERYQDPGLGEPTQESVYTSRKRLKIRQ